MIKLTREDIQFMFKELSMPEYLRTALEDVANNKKGGLSDEMADELRDLCAERLDTHGFDPEYSPTAVGKILENLIDKLYVG
jgi:hypothetical protein